MKKIIKITGTSKIVNYLQDQEGEGDLSFIELNKSPFSCKYKLTFNGHELLFSAYETIILEDSIHLEGWVQGSVNDVGRLGIEVKLK